MLPIKQKNIARALILLVGVFHLYPFLTGYRLSADDVAYHWYAMNGIDASWQFIKSAAITQGRIVHFPDLITSLIGAYYADSLLFRIIYTILYFLNFGLFALYINKICKANAGWFFLLVLFILHPLDFFHTSPGSYPFKISIPILLILIARISILKIREEVKNSQNIANEAPWVLLCLAAMLFSEYAFTFALALMIMEFSTRFMNDSRQYNKSSFQSVLDNLQSWKTVRDFFTILVFLSFYIGFRLIFPSSYDGNQLPNKLNLIAFIKTMVGHILGGSIISSFSRYDNIGDYVHGNIDFVGYLSLIALPVATFLSAFFLLNEQRQDLKLSYDATKMKVVLAFSSGLAVTVTAPVAITTKYQSWCGKVENCLFLDSSLSYLGFGVFLATMLLYLAKFSAKTGKPGLYIFCAFLACIAAAAQLNNLRRESSMAEYVQGWKRAKALACYSEIDLANVSGMKEIVEPVPLISMHPSFDAESYWALYIENLRQRNICQRINPPALPILKLNDKIYFRKHEEAVKYLRNGWSRPENWGVWSNNNQATIELPMNFNYKLILVEVDAFVNESHPRQRIDVYIDNKPVKNITLTKATGNIVEIIIPPMRQADILYSHVTTLQFKFQDAISPLQLGVSEDSRELSIGLVSMEVK